MVGYRRGASFENIVKDILIEDNWFAIRSSGSHSIIDVMAIKQGVVWLIQCRLSGNLSSKEREALFILATKHLAHPILAYKSEGNIIFEEIKSRLPTFRYEVINGKFTRIDS